MLQLVGGNFIRGMGSIPLIRGVDYFNTYTISLLLRTPSSTTYHHPNLMFIHGTSKEIRNECKKLYCMNAK